METEGVGVQRLSAREEMDVAMELMNKTVLCAVSGILFEFKQLLIFFNISGCPAPIIQSTSNDKHETPSFKRIRKNRIGWFQFLKSLS